MDRQTESITIASVKFIVFMFIAVALYFSLSNPVDAILDGLWDIETTHDQTNTYLSEYGPDYKAAVKIAFAIMLAIPATMFIFWVFSQEPAIGTRRIR